MDLTGRIHNRPSYWTEFDARGEHLVMPIRRGWSVVGWALIALGFLAYQHLSQVSSPLHWIDWLWAVTLLVMLLLLLVNVLTSKLAREVLWVEGGELVLAWTMLGLKREERYRLSEIRNLASDREATSTKSDRLISPLKDFGKVGAVNFDYRGKTVGIGAALDRAHADQVVIWIRRRAPRSAVE